MAFTEESVHTVASNIILLYSEGKLQMVELFIFNKCSPLTLGRNKTLRYSVVKITLHFKCGSMPSAY